MKKTPQTKHRYLKQLLKYLQKITHNHLEDTNPIRKVAGGGTAAAGVRKRHECLDCGKSFPTPSKLQRHRLIHTGERPFSCSLCPRSYSQLVHLKNHMVSHNRDNNALLSSPSTSTAAATAPKIEEAPEDHEEEPIVVAPPEDDQDQDQSPGSTHNDWTVT